MPRQRPTRRIEQKHAVREGIRTAALDLFEQNGFEATTIDDIVARAQIGRRTFFRYFPCKEAVFFSDGIFLSLIEEFDNELSAGAPPLLALARAIQRDVYGSTVEADDITQRRRRLRVQFLDEPAVADFYHREITTLANGITAVMRQHPQHAAIPNFPEVVGGLFQTMTLAHLARRETHHFTVDDDAWRGALLAAADSFAPAPSTPDPR